MVSRVESMCRNRSYENKVINVFIDLVPDNPVTYEKNNWECAASKNLYYSDFVYRFFILNMLAQFYHFRISGSMKDMYASLFACHLFFLGFEAAKQDFKFKPPSGKTLEKCYKDILKGSIRRCMTNDSAHSGFYKHSCSDCSRIKCINHESSIPDLKCKAVCRYTGMPIFEIVYDHQRS